MAKLLILDMDGTIRHPKSNHDGFILHPKDQILYPDAIAAMNLAKRQGFTIIGASNQGGVAKKHKSLEDCIAEQEHTIWLACKADVMIHEILFCTDYEGKLCYGATSHLLNDYCNRFDDCGSFRKPSSGMIELAMKLYLDPFTENEVIFVGDRDIDEQAAKNANVQFVWADEWRSSYWIA